MTKKEKAATKRGRTIEKKCLVCKDEFFPRVADVERGWGKYCSKSCKAKSKDNHGWSIPDDDDSDQSCDEWNGN